MVRSLSVLPFALIGLMGLASCATTGEAEKSLKTSWEGRPVDSFFAAFGPPASRYALSEGRTIYTWRGGRIDKHIPPDYEIVRTDPFGDPIIGPRFGPPFRRPWFDDPQLVMVSPAHDVTLQCEAQITADRKGRIISATISGDTPGEGFSQSRCADLFGVDKRARRGT